MISSFIYYSSYRTHAAINGINYTSNRMNVLCGCVVNISLSAKLYWALFNHWHSLTSSRTCNAIDPGNELCDSRVDSRLVLTRWRAPRRDSHQHPATIPPAHQRTARITLRWGDNHINIISLKKHKCTGMFYVYILNNLKQKDSLQCRSRPIGLV